MSRRTLCILSSFLFLANCDAGIGSRTVVERTGPDELLKLRAGPGLGYRIIMGLPDGTELNVRDCVTEIGQLWCRVSVADAPQIKGYVSADYLSDI
ncbi:SH3 domain-containing protein [Aestuariibius sp. 2305UL40-4]|uniref:SH3 domain-containing protein n=1 Tax=Aestuariibius violaceus TaxID=3234132 RepID=UPI00345E7E22